jgi:hypothetical protein
MNAAQKALKAMRMIHAAFLLASILYILVAAAYAHTAEQSMPGIFPIAAGLVAMSSVGIAFFFRMRDVQPSGAKLRDNPDDATAAAKWRGGVLLSLVFCESIVLFGLALRFLGFSWDVAGIFYAVGTLLMLAWTPKLDLPPQ